MAFEDSSLWLNKSDSGKGLLLSDSDDEDAPLYSVPVSQVQDLLDGNRSGVNFSKITEDEG